MGNYKGKIKQAGKSYLTPAEAVSLSWAESYKELKSTTFVVKILEFSYLGFSSILGCLPLDVIFI